MQINAVFKAFEAVLLVGILLALSVTLLLAFVDIAYVIYGKIMAPPVFVVDANGLMNIALHSTATVVTAHFASVARWRYADFLKLKTWKMTNGEKECTIRSYLAAYNNFNIDEIVTLVDPKVVFQDISDGEISTQTQGVEEFCQLANKSKDLFLSRYQEATNFDFAWDVVTVEISYVGVLATGLPSGMKNGEVPQLTGRSAFEFKDRKIFKITDARLI